MSGKFSIMLAFPEMTDRLHSCAVSIDLDPLRCYHAILGLPPVEDALAEVVMARAVPRFAEIFARRRLHATFFVVGEDLASPIGAQRVAELAQTGHEIGNHSQTHPYELARMPEGHIDQEIGAAEEQIRAVTGRRPVGFRAPRENCGLTSSPNKTRSNAGGGAGLSDRMGRPKYETRQRVLPPAAES